MSAARAAALMDDQQPVYVRGLNTLLAFEVMPVCLHTAPDFISKEEMIHECKQASTGLDGTQSSEIVFFLYPHCWLRCTVVPSQSATKCKTCKQLGLP